MAEAAKEETWFERERRKRETGTHNVAYSGPDSSASTVNPSSSTLTPKFSKTDAKDSQKVYDLNTVTRDMLMSVDHIGASLADSILKYREAQSFKSVKQLTKVPHIGNKTYDKIAHRFCVNTASSSQS